MGQLLQAILHRLLQDDSGHEAADHAAEALLPLLLAEGAVLQAEGERVIAGLPDQAAKVGVCLGWWQVRLAGRKVAEGQKVYSLPSD